VKVLFIGEGRHDIGDSSANPNHPRPAGGTIPTLAARVCPIISSDSIALAWREIQRFSPDARKRGFPAKVTGAALLAARKFDCAGCVCVTDCDGDEDRRLELQEGANRARKLFPALAIATGLAFQSIEAWTLGAPEGIAAELEIEVEDVRRQYPSGIHVEDLHERSGKVEHRPKALLEKIAGLKHREDSTDFRQAVAERTDVAALEHACAQGFHPFAEELRAAFTRRPDE
jgi:hypothetical protein